MSASLNLRTGSRTGSRTEQKIVVEHQDVPQLHKSAVKGFMDTTTTTAI
jgi:hypothetical protein